MRASQFELVFRSSKVVELQKVNVTNERIKHVNNKYEDAKINIGYSSSFNMQASRSIVSRDKKPENTLHPASAIHSVSQSFDGESLQIL